MANDNFTSNNLFKHTKDITDLASNKYLMRGVMDFSNLAQWDMFESGYAFLKIIKKPSFLTKLADNNGEYKRLLDTYTRILEFEFKSVSGLPNLDSETLQITNGMSTMELIGKTNYESNVTFSMPYYERSGSPLTKVHELFLRGIKDPKTGYKHYNGLIQAGQLDGSYENETFTFLFGFTDNTGMNLERAYMILGAQPTSAPFSELYDYSKGTIENKELSLEFRGYCVTGIEVDACGEKVLEYLNSSSLTTKDGYLIKNESTVHYQNLIKDVNESGAVLSKVQSNSANTY